MSERAGFNKRIDTVECKPMSVGRWLAGGAILTAAIAGGLFIWLRFQQPALPEGFASGNGRIEATEIDVAAQWGGRVKEVLSNEGDLVDADQVVARMDTANLEAQLRQAEAQVKQAQDARTSVAALVSQRESELAFAKKDLGRILGLTAKGFVSRQDADLKRTKQETTAATLAAAKAQAVEAESAIAAAAAAADRLKIDIDQGILKAPRAGRIQYRLTEPGEVLAAGGKVLTLLDLTDVDLTLFLPEMAAGRVALGAEARIVLDAAPDRVIPAQVSFVAAKAQFTPKTVETRTEREKLMFRVKVQINPDLLRQHLSRVKTGLPGVAYVRLDPKAPWPAALQVKLPP
jgi:HlyD family secretion protein